MEFLRELVVIYLTDTPKHLAQLADALSRQDAAVATRAAHTIKGSSGNLGAEQFSHMAHGIESACKSNNLAAATSSLPDLNMHFALVAAALKQVVTDG